jgi:predicted CopG family antitoxin
MVYKRITITIPQETLIKLKALSKKENRSMSNLIRNLIDQQK